MYVFQSVIFFKKSLRLLGLHLYLLKVSQVVALTSRCRGLSELPSLLLPSYALNARSLEEVTVWSLLEQPWEGVHANRVAFGTVCMENGPKCWVQLEGGTLWWGGAQAVYCFLPDVLGLCDSQEMGVHLDASTPPSPSSQDRKFISCSQWQLCKMKSSVNVWRIDYPDCC